MPIEIVGLNSKKFIGYNLQTAKTIDFSNLTGIVEYLPEELYIKVKAGTSLSLIEETLEKNNQQLAFEPIDFGFIQNGKSNKGTIGEYLIIGSILPRNTSFPPIMIPGLIIE